MENFDSNGSSSMWMRLRNCLFKKRLRKKTVATIGMLGFVPFAALSIHAVQNNISVVGSIFNIPITVIFGNAGDGPQKSASEPAPPSQSSRARTQEVTNQPVKCLNGDTPVSCSTPHTGEIIGTDQSCDDNTLENYLGAEVGGSFSPELSYELSDQGCKLLFPHPISSRLEGLWIAHPQKEPFLRACYRGDNVEAHVVGCDQPHNGEIVYEQRTDTLTDFDCIRKAEDYMSSVKSKWETKLKVTNLSGEDREMCVAKTRDGAWLESPLRNLGSGVIDTRTRD